MYVCMYALYIMYRCTYVCMYVCMYVDEILLYSLLRILVKICYKRDPQNNVIFVQISAVSALTYLGT